MFSSAIIFIHKIVILEPDLVGKPFFSFIALLGVFIGAMKQDISANSQALMIFGFSQIEFIIIMLTISIMSGISLLAGYGRSLEEKINFLRGEPLTIWESKIVKGHLLKWKSGFIFMQSVLWSCYVCLFLLLAIGCYVILDKDIVFFSIRAPKSVILYMQVLELVVVLISAIVGSKGGDSTEKLIKEKYFVA